MTPDDMVYIDQALVVSAFFSGLAGGICGAAVFALLRVAAARLHRVVFQWR